MMLDDTLRRVPNAARPSRLMIALLVLAIGATVLVGPVAADDASNESERFVVETPDDVEPPETAAIEVGNIDGDTTTFHLTSHDDHFEMEAEIEADDNMTILLDTGVVGAGDPNEYLSADGGEIRNVTVHTNDIEGDRLPPGFYHVRFRAEHWVLENRFEVEPTVDFDLERMDLGLNKSELEQNPTRTVAGTIDLDPGEAVRVRVEAKNDESYRLEDVAIVDEDGRFEATFDLSTAPNTRRLDVTVTHNDLKVGSFPFMMMDYDPYRGDREAKSNGIVIVYEGSELELEAAPDQRIKGEADLEAGESVSIRLRAPTFVIENDTDVAEDGTFEAGFDLESVEPGTELAIKARPTGDSDVSGSAPGIVIEPGADERDNATTAREGAALSDDDRDDESLLSATSTRSLGFLAVGTVLAVVGTGVMLGFGPSRLRRES